MDIAHITKLLSDVSARIDNCDVRNVLTEIATRSKDLKNINLNDQSTMAGILGSYLHQAYCDGRKLEKPLENGLVNNPRVKQLSDDLDQKFINDVLTGKIPTSDTLWIDNGNVFMDIANTPFTKLSPFWQYDNFMAGSCATRSVITNWDGITHENPQVREYVTVAVANAIHESWIARGNVGDWNKDLETAYINLPMEEKDKDLVHYQMAVQMISMLYKIMNVQKQSDFGVTR